MQVVYWCELNKSIETLHTRPESLDHATDLMRSLFAAGLSTFAQVLADDGLVLKNMAPLSVLKAQPASVTPSHAVQP